MRRASASSRTTDAQPGGTMPKPALQRTLGHKQFLGVHISFDLAVAVLGRSAGGGEEMGWFTRFLPRPSSPVGGAAPGAEAIAGHAGSPVGGYVAPGDHSVGTLLETDALIAFMKSGRLVREVAFDVHMRCGAVVQGNATAESASWTCPCGSEIDMMSDAATMVTGGLLIRCPGCSRVYWLGQGLPLVGVQGVWETGSGPVGNSTATDPGASANSRDV